MNICKKSQIFHFLQKYSPKTISNTNQTIPSELKEARKRIICLSRFHIEFKYFIKNCNYPPINHDSKIFLNNNQISHEFVKSNRSLLSKSISIDSKLTELAKQNRLIDQKRKRTKRKDKNINYSDSDFFDSPINQDLIQLFSPEEASPFIGLSIIIKNITILIKFIYENPLEFAENIVNHLDHARFLHFTQSIIPSIFGYFSSQEFLELGAIFYEKLLSISSISPDTAIIILDPFLNSVASCRFIEKVITDFFNHADLNIDNNDQNRKVKSDTENVKAIDYRYKNSKILLNCINDSISLLPKQFFRVFSAIKDRGWTLKDWCNLFFGQFVFESMNDWIKASNSDDFSQIFIDLRKYQFMDKNELTLFFTNLSEMPSKYEIPEMFRCFGLSYLNYFLCINDLKQLMHFLLDCKLLPASVDIAAFEKVPPKVSNSLIWCSCYLLEKNDFKNEHDRIIFDSYESLNEELKRQENQNLFGNKLNSLLKEKNGDIDFILNHSGNGDFHKFVENYCFRQLINDANDFENMIETLRYGKLLSEFEDILKMNENVLILSELTAIQDIPQIVQNLPNQIKQTIFLEKVDTSQFKSIHDSLTNFGVEWDFLVHSPHFTKAFQNMLISVYNMIENQSLDINLDQNCLKSPNEKQNQFWQILSPSSLFKSQNDDHSQSAKMSSETCLDLISFQTSQMPSGFFEILNFFTFVSHVPLAQKFKIVMKAMNRLDLIFPEKKINQMMFFLFLQNIPGRILLPIYVELNVFGMREQSVFEYCSELERKRWTRFEGLILKFASQDSNFLTKLLNEQASLQNSFNDWKKKFLC